jgi:glycosyltransferase involved in cell wall biosynthesis
MRQNKGNSVPSSSCPYDSRLDCTIEDVVDSHLHILQVNSVDSGGGAAKVAWDLFQAYHRKGYDSRMVVGSKSTSDPFVWELDHDPYRRGLPGLWVRVWKPFQQFEKIWSVLRTFHRRMLLAVDTQRINNRRKGIEDFEFPGTAHLLDLTPARPDILHFHNLHGNYFDLRELAMLSQNVPVVLTLHDTWLLSGHCAYSIGCERWKTGCGDCPDLTIPPSIRRDATAYNWQRKREIFSKSRLHIATPSRWLMEEAEQSILIPGAVEIKIIPNGVDLTIFQPNDKRATRASLGIQKDTKVILFAVKKGHHIIKDYPTLQSACTQIAERLQDQNLIIIDLGEKASIERIGRTEIRFVAYQKDPKNLALYYQAADVFIHAARADTFPTTILESLACGTPVVATEVGGIPEQISDGKTGFLVPPGDARAMAARIEQILSDGDLRQKMSQAAADSARRRFDLEREVDDYLKWYESIRRETGGRR